MKKITAPNEYVISDRTKLKLFKLSTVAKPADESLKIIHTPERSIHLDRSIERANVILRQLMISLEARNPITVDSTTRISKI